MRYAALLPLAALLSWQGLAVAQTWPFEVGPKADLMDRSTSQFDRFRALPEMEAPPAPRQPLAAPVWIPPVPPSPPPRPTTRRAVAPPPVRPAPEPRTEAAGLRQADLDGFAQRLTERERALDRLREELAEDRRQFELQRRGQPPAAR